MKKQLLLFLCIIMSHSVQLQGISSKNALPTLFKELKHIESQLNQLNKHITPADTFFRNSNFTMPPLSTLVRHLGYHPLKGSPTLYQWVWYDFYTLDQALTNLTKRIYSLRNSCFQNQHVYDYHNYEKPLSSCHYHRSKFNLDLEGKDNVVARAEIPNLDHEATKITILGNVLHIEAYTFKKEPDINGIHAEHITIIRALPSPVVAELAQAEYDDNTLVITMPKVKQQSNIIKISKK